jgi:hypothetical protein
MVDLEAPGAILLIHAGELADVRDLLDSLGIGFSESVPGATATPNYRNASIVLSGPQYLLDRLEAGDADGPTRIAVLEGEARTLRAMLSRGGVEWMVRRPFHPAALRLLLLHCIYRGPEKRSARRVSIGGAVHFQLGWRKRGALLAEISERDCRFLADRDVGIGKHVKLRLPAELMESRTALVLGGRVVRTAAADEGDGAHEVCLVFDPPSANDSLRLKELVSRHEQGPAVLAGATVRHAARNRPTDPSEERRSVRSVIRFGESCELGSEQTEGEGNLDGDTELRPDGRERRQDPRHEFRRRIIALGEQATRVLVGRDISPQGMRVDPSQVLELGQTLQIAIHVPGNETPLVVDVEVVRDDGERGLLMAFRDLSLTAEQFLHEMLTGLAGVSAGGVPEDSTGATVISEIVDGDPL